MKRILKSIGPAIIVAAVVLGPGSILTSSKVGANIGLLGIPVIIVAAILMIAMVALSARLGVICQGSLGDELAARIGRPVTVAIGLVLFILIALFQSSNNVALVGGLESLWIGQAQATISPTFEPGWRIAILVVVNLLVIASLYLLRDLYRTVERAMKVLVLLVTVSFLINFVVAFVQPRTFATTGTANAIQWIPMIAMVGTTFSVAGAFYQAYLVKEKGWGTADLQRGLWDSILSISVLGLVTCLILATSWRVFYGAPDGTELSSVGDVARQLEPFFGPAARIVFCIGILAGALSSFLVNALIGGTVLSDTMGQGSRLTDRWTIHLTTAALLVGAGVASASLTVEGSTVHLIAVAQALTVLGVPALAGALLFLGTRKDLNGNQHPIPVAIIALVWIGFFVSILMAGLTVNRLYQKFGPPSLGPPSTTQLFQPAESIEGGHRYPMFGGDRFWDI